MVNKLKIAIICILGYPVTLPVYLIGVFIDLLNIAYFFGRDKVVPAYCDFLFYIFKYKKD